MENQNDENIENVANQINSIINSHPVEEQTDQNPVDVNSPQKASYQQQQQQSMPLDSKNSQKSQQSQQQKVRPISQKQLAKAEQSKNQQVSQIPQQQQLQIQLSRQSTAATQLPQFAYGETTSQITMSYFILVSKTLCAGLILCQIAKIIFFPFSEYDFGVYHLLVIFQFIMYIIGLVAFHKGHLKQIKIFLIMFGVLGISLCVEKIVLMNGSSISLYNYFEKGDYHEKVQTEVGEEDEEPRQNTLHKFKIVILHGIIASVYVKAVCFWVFYKGFKKMQKFLQLHSGSGIQQQQQSTVVTETQEQFANVTHHTKNYSQATENSENKNQFSFSNVHGEQQKELFDCKVEHDHKPSAGITLKKQN